jgi:hypothetical protein
MNYHDHTGIVHLDQSPSVLAEDNQRSVDSSLFNNG